MARSRKKKSPTKKKYKSGTCVRAGRNTGYVAKKNLTTFLVTMPGLKRSKVLSRSSPKLKRIKCSLSMKKAQKKRKSGRR